MKLKDAEELLADTMALLHKMKAEKPLWDGSVGLAPGQREDINELIRRHNALKRGKK